ncbi:hypothetical protein ACFPK9_04960 [Rubritalea spongiae]|uniref:Uncharacterized protein n=1 Tax=Rubritalea spongiae TaxID=430797 RepID=A0ABW5E4U1_9BACT
MNQIFTIAIKWLCNKLALFAMIIVVLLSILWAKNQWNYITMVAQEIEKKERLHATLISEVHTLEEQKAALEQKLGELKKDYATKEHFLNIAKKKEAIAKQSYDSKKAEEGWYYTKLTHRAYYLSLNQELLKYNAAKTATRLASTNLKSTKALLAESPAGKELISLSDNLLEKQSFVRDLDESITLLRADIASKPIEKLKQAVGSVALPAFYILLGAILTPIAIKAVIYFLIAPLISKTKPVQLLPECNGNLELKNCNVSVPIELEPGDELIVHSNYLQVAGTGPGKKTKLLFSWKMPFTSMAAGLFMMVSVKNKNTASAKVTISPKKDLFDKMAHLHIPLGSAAVIYPRSLIGVLAKNNDSIKITRHWNLFNLHSWVTFQFRYLVIHGETSILIRGCRGVRAEAIQPQIAKMQDQTATIGFSANLNYSGERCETFLDYLLSRDELFNDKFSGADGIYLTEEIPHKGNKTGFFGRGLEGLLDGILKGFGI